MTIDQHLADQLHLLADREAAGPANPPTRLLLERGRRARRRRMVALTGATVVATAAVVTGVAALPPRPPAHSPSSPNSVAAQRQGPPQLQLADAVAASGSISYAFTVKLVAGAETRTATGEFDPAARTGVMHDSFGGEQRLVDGARFIGDGKDNWKFQNDGEHDTLTFSGFGDDVFTATGDPVRLLQQLDKAGTVTEVSPGVYHFTIQHPASPPAVGPGSPVYPPSDGPRAVTEGEAHVVDGRVKKIVYSTPFYDVNGQVTSAAVTVEFTGYGKKVKVQKPTHWVD